MKHVNATLKQKFVLFVVFLICFLSYVLLSIDESLGINSFHSVIFYFQNPIHNDSDFYQEGIALNLILDLFINSSLKAFFTLFLGLFLIGNILNYKNIIRFRSESNDIYIHFSGECIKNIDICFYKKNILPLILFFSTAFFVKVLAFDFKMYDYLKFLVKPPSTIYEQNYVDPKSVDISLDKRNLVIVFLESLEKDFYNQKIFNENYLPNIQKRTLENLSFSGFNALVGTHYTIAGIVSSYCGIPLLPTYSIVRNSDLESYLPNATCLPQILKSNGYQNYFVQGADIKFSSKDRFLLQHGFDHVFGRDEIKEKIDYKEQLNRGEWGSAKGLFFDSINDYTTFSFAKDLLQDISSKNEPFFLSILTNDTHPPGFVNKKCKQKDKKKYFNALLCVDSFVDNFVEWFEKQSFFKDTTLVIISDHLYPIYGNFDIYKQKKREIINIFINAYKKPKKTSRNFSTLDLFPTIVESIGEVQGDKLGLGVSLFSDKVTLVEKFGKKKINQELNRKSVLYQSFR